MLCTITAGITLMHRWDTARNSCEKEEEHYTESTPVTSPAVPVAAATSEPTSVSGEDENLNDQDQVKRPLCQVKP